MSANNLAFERVIKVTLGDKDIENLRVDFNIQKSLKKEPNTGSITIYNLSPETRSHFQELAPKNDKQPGIPLRILVGYKDQKDSLDQIFLGDLRTVISKLEPPDWITVMTGGDGEKALQTAKLNTAMSKNTPLQTVINLIAKSFNVGLNAAQIDSIARTAKFTAGGKAFANGFVANGPAVYALGSICKSCNLEFSMQDNSLQLLNKGKPLPGIALPVSSQTGMIGYPEVDNKGVIKFQHIIKPGFRCGGAVQVTSLNANVSGFYRITKLNYQGSTYDITQWTINVEGERIANLVP